LNVSEIESFTGSILDAVAAGVPLVASDRDFFREICSTGFIPCDPHAPDSVADAIVAALSSSEGLSMRDTVDAGVSDYRVFSERLLRIVES
jgi:glycosyltransferase involved in cell wall biosynthesis